MIKSGVNEDRRDRLIENSLKIKRFLRSTSSISQFSQIEMEDNERTSQLDTEPL